MTHNSSCSSTYSAEQIATHPICKTDAMFNHNSMDAGCDYRTAKVSYSTLLVSNNNHEHSQLEFDEVKSLTINSNS